MPVSLLNTARADRQFDLRASCLGQYWSIEIYEDLDGDGALSSGERSTVEERMLATGEVFKGFVEVTIPDNSSLVGKSCEIGFWAEDETPGSLDAGGVHARLTVVGTPEAEDLDGDGKPVIYAGNVR